MREYSTFDFVLYLRLSDMGAMCKQLSEQAKKESPGLATRLARASKAFETMLKEVEYGPAQRELL